MKSFLTGVLFAAALIGGAAAWVWYRAPEYLPEAWRRTNPQSPDYAPSLYRWKDDQGRTQITDTPPGDRPYQTVDIDPDTNVVPDSLPTERDAQRARDREP
ncbi:MAG: DUF4124 domain-containing protein [Xanthomonadales bacterium]|nr:DUF4124 domain-containing protein [Xanthomonadales bacterium]